MWWAEIRSLRHKKSSIDRQLTLHGLRLQFSVYFYHLFCDRRMLLRFEGDAKRSA